MAEVWNAFDPQLQRNVAVKIFHDDLVNDADFMNRCWTVALALEEQRFHSLHHPNVVQILGFQIARPAELESHVAYVVMDYIEGPTLADYLRDASYKKAFPCAADIVHLFGPIAAALDYAHQKGVIHGNLKLANILLDQHNTSRHPMGEPMLADFGLSKLLGTSTGILNSSGLALPFYLSP